MISLGKYLIGAAAGTAAALLPAGAQARVISNIAQISWTGPSGPTAVQSNQVDITVETPPVPIQTNVYSIAPPGSDGLQSRIDGSGCSAGGQGSLSAAPASGTGRTITLNRTDQFTAGQPIAFGINSLSENLDPNERDSFEVIVHTANGDEETVLMREDANNSGFFVGFLATLRTPPAMVRGDCRLSIDPGTNLEVTLTRPGNPTIIATAMVSFLVDPFGIVFDSGNGAAVPGARVTLINVATGQPADVFGDDGISQYPNTVITGATVTDTGGNVYTFPPGDYRFPLVAPGTYRLVVEPPSPYGWPSTATPTELSELLRPDTGTPFTISAGSFGASFVLVTPAPVRIDIPVDRPAAALLLRKSSSTAEAIPGQALQYRIDVRNNDIRRSTGPLTVSDDLPRAVRLRAQSLRYNGLPVTPMVTPDGRRFTVALPALAAGQSGILTYVGEIRPDARPGDAVNTAIARDNRGTISNVTDASVRVRRDILGDRLTIIGRVTNGGCSINPDDAPGIAGVRVMLQDGSFTITDSDGRYHFEGVQPGLHVVQIDPSSLPSAHVAVNCTRNNRSAGSAISRFVDGRGGELRRADFRALPITAPEAPADAIERSITRIAAPARPIVPTDPVAAGGETDFFAGQTAGIAWLFPGTDHNPRSPAIRIAIKHLVGQRVQLGLAGQPVDPLNYDGSSTSPDGTFMVSIWRGVEIREGDNRFTARVVNADGSIAQELAQTIHFGTGAIDVAFVRPLSLLVADGLNRPVIAVRLTDRDGRPMRNGTTGDFSVAPPHSAAIEADLQQERQLSGLDRAPTVWHVVGDDGMAYIELNPTTASGTARLTFNFRDEQVTRTRELDVWLNPGDRPWTIVGFAAGTLGYNTLDDRMEPVAETLPDDNLDSRIALYAKGRVLGQWLLTLSYDSDRDNDETRFGGVIDPRAYYTIYADRADRGFDAASVRNLYVRLERPQFYALFGDFETGINEPQLARYQRSMNGGRAEYRGDNFAATAYVADTPYRYRRDELQGVGLTGPYQLGARDILANSERVKIEVRDRLRSDRIIESRVLTRHIDYDIDYFAGTLRFREPILSRDSGLNPQFIITDYEVAGVGQRVLNAGGRASWTNDAQSLRVGATFIHDETDDSQSDLGGVDFLYRPSAGTEIRAEYARSNGEATTPTGTDIGTADAWLVEVEHHSSRLDLLGYARQRGTGFGVGQLSAAGEASRRFGFDGKVRFGSDLSLLASGWQEDYLATDARRRAGQLLGEWRTLETTLRAGLTLADDRLSTGERNRSTIAQIGGTQRLFNQALELDANAEFALGGNASVDFPTRQSFGARYRITEGLTLTGVYELANGRTVDARTFRAGFDLTPWDGGRATLTGNRQNIGELGTRSYAAYGLAQSLQLSEVVTIDATIDGQRTLNGIRAINVLDPAQPVASGGLIGVDGSLTEDFTALTAGVTFRREEWTLTTRAEFRDGEINDRFGITVGGIRRIGDGRAFGGLFSWTKAHSFTSVATETVSAEMSWAHRPSDSRWSVLNKVEFRIDDVDNAVFGQPGPIGGPALTVAGDVRSHRVVNSLAINYSPLHQDDGSNGLWREAGEYALFWGVRYNSDRFGTDDVSGWSTVVGADIRFDLSETVGFGVSGNLRTGTNARSTAYSVGPQIVFAPAENTNIVLGYNLAGFADRDFEEARFSRGGIYATVRIKFDQTTFAGLGL
jgi:hypothetical protein